MYLDSGRKERQYRSLREARPGSRTWELTLCVGISMLLLSGSELLFGQVNRIESLVAGVLVAAGAIVVHVSARQRRRAARAEAAFVASAERVEGRVVDAFTTETAEQVEVCWVVVEFPYAGSAQRFRQQLPERMFEQLRPLRAATVAYDTRHPGRAQLDPAWMREVLDGDARETMAAHGTSSVVAGPWTSRRVHADVAGERPSAIRERADVERRDVERAGASARSYARR